MPRARELKRRQRLERIILPPTMGDDAPMPIENCHNWRQLNVTPPMMADGVWRRVIDGISARDVLLAAQTCASMARLCAAELELGRQAQKSCARALLSDACRRRRQSLTSASFCALASCDSLRRSSGAFRSVAVRVDDLRRRNDATIAIVGVDGDYGNMFYRVPLRHRRHTWSALSLDDARLALYEAISGDPYESEIRKICQQQNHTNCLVIDNVTLIDGSRATISIGGWRLERVSSDAWLTNGAARMGCHCRRRGSGKDADCKASIAPILLRCLINRARDAALASPPRVRLTTIGDVRDIDDTSTADDYDWSNSYSHAATKERDVTRALIRYGVQCRRGESIAMFVARMKQCESDA